ncbi:MAG: hypothetical protein ACLQGP_11865 [Isosphaeraceae bacterium]
MRPRQTFRPDLRDCVLEDRLAPVISNLGVIALTTGGFMLLIPFPGAFVTPSGSAIGPGPGSSSSVSGTPVNVPFFVLGGGGISSALPGNITGVPSLGAGGPAGSTGGISVTINVGSGADEATNPVIPLVTRNTIANDLLNPPPLIGGQPSGDTSAPLPAGQGGASVTPAPAPAAPPPTSGAASGPAMPPPGSSLNGPYLRLPSLFPGGFPPIFPLGSQPGTASGAPTPSTPLPPPGNGQSGPSAGSVQ